MTLSEHGPDACPPRSKLGTTSGAHVDVVEDEPPWPLRYAWTFPQSVQVVAGIPVPLNELRFAFGSTKAAKDYIASTSCRRRLGVEGPPAHLDGAKGHGRAHGQRPRPLHR